MIFIFFIVVDYSVLTMSAVQQRLIRAVFDFSLLASSLPPHLFFFFFGGQLTLLSLYV